MSHFDPEKYSDLNSPIHNWDSRARIVSLFVLIFSIAVAGNIISALTGLVISLSLIYISKIPLTHVARFTKWPAIFILPFVVLLPFTTRGDTLYTVSVFSISYQGISLGLFFLIRALGATLLALLLIGTAPFTVTIRSLQELGLPGPLTQIFLFAYRYIFLLREEMQTMNRSLNSRGFVKRSNLRTAKITAMAVAMLLIRSYERSENVFHAMLSRGYDGTVPTDVKRSICGSDFIKCFFVIGAAIFIQVF